MSGRRNGNRKEAGPLQQAVRIVWAKVRKEMRIESDRSPSRGPLVDARCSLVEGIRPRLQYSYGMAGSS